ncbi:ATP-binding protein [Embleya sp. NPDC001921]
MRSGLGVLPLTSRAAAALADQCAFEGHGYTELLRREPQSARAGRDFVSSILRAWGLGRVDDDARVVATELVTNALQHVDEGPIRVTVCRKPQDRRVRIAVLDRSDTVPLRRAAGRDAKNGRGLLVVHELTGGCWGTDLLAVGKRVRADIHVGGGW